MIVQPDFLRHFKTRKLVTITGNPASPLALFSLWAHCQASRAWEFPDLKKDDLASICEWNSEKISCDKALIACGWIEKMPGGGYRVRNWDEHNKSLIANWNRNPSGKKSDEDEGNPTDTPRTPHDVPDKNRTDRTEQIELREGNRTEQTEATTPPHSEVSGASGSSSFASQVEGSGSGSGSVLPSKEIFKQMANGISTSKFGVPTLDQIKEAMNAEVPRGGSDYAYKWMTSMTKQGWRDEKGRPLHNWKVVAVSFAKGCRRADKRDSR